MPKMDGFQVLAAIKDDPSSQKIPVIILSGSKNIHDVKKSYENGANSFIQKPVSYEEFVVFVNGFNFYWQFMNRLPRENI